MELEHLKLDDQAITAKHKPIEKETQSTSLEVQTGADISLAELSQRYLHAKTEAGYPDKTIKGYQDSHQLMLEILGNCAVDSLTHQDGRKLVETIKKLPSNRSKCDSSTITPAGIELKATEDIIGSFWDDRPPTVSYTHLTLPTKA